MAENKTGSNGGAQLGFEGLQPLSQNVNKRRPDRPDFLRSVSIDEFARMRIPPRELILDPWLPTQGLAMIHSKRGVGKTHVALGIAYGVASGSGLFSWHAPRPRGVLFVDGEMPASALQERIKSLIRSDPHSTKAALDLITPDLQERGIPDLATADGQFSIDQHIKENIELVILDNLSALVRSGKENEGESWQPIQSWALGHRAKGRSILFIHHSGKNDNQRGTSRREDVLDTVIHLRHPPDYSPDQGAAFIVEYEKSRGFFGEQAQAFEAKLTVGEQGQSYWTTKRLEDSTYERVLALHIEGLKPKEIAHELNINKSTVSRHMKRALVGGALKVKQG